MSVLIGMLEDLDRRGVAPPVAADLRPAFDLGAPPPRLSEQPDRGSGRHGLRAVGVMVAALGLFVAGVLVEHSLDRALPDPALGAMTEIRAGIGGGLGGLRGRERATRRAPIAVAKGSSLPALAFVAPVPPSANDLPAAPEAVMPREPMPERPPVDGPAKDASPAPVPALEGIHRSGSADDEAADLSRAQALAAAGRQTEAIELLQRRLDELPLHAASRLALAGLLRAGGQDAAALALLLAGAHLDPVRFAAPAARLQVQQGALDSARSTLALVPAAQRSAADHALLAAIAQRAGQADMAVNEYRQALAGGPARAVWLAGLGAALEQLALRDEALEAYRRTLLAGDAGGATAQFARQRIAALEP